MALAVEAGHDADALEALGDVGQDRRDPVADPLVAACSRRVRNQSDRATSRGHEHEQGDQRQLDVHRQQHDRDDDHRQPLDAELDEAVLEQLLQRFDVARHPGHDHAGLLAGEEVERQALEVREDPDPELEHHPRRRSGR